MDGGLQITFIIKILATTSLTMTYLPYTVDKFHLLFHGCILPGLGTYHFSTILLPMRKSGTIRHLENGGNQNFTEAFVTLIVTM